jgi:hypothetical protein
MTMSDPVSRPMAIGDAPFTRKESPAFGPTR